MEKALLVGFARDSQEKWKEIDSLEELKLLTETAGAEVFEAILQVRHEPDPAYLIGKGKVKQIQNIVKTYGLNLVIFNRELTPTQHRNLEHEIGVKVIDRTELILDIFAQHARTAEAKIQVELAQLEYRMSRLIGKGLELSRLGGGIGTRGPGEKKLEVDRRRIVDRIVFLKRKLKEIERTKELHRKKRRNLFKVTLVGYTNAGKSTIMNKLTHAHQVVEDKLFATLDAVTRRLKDSPPHKPILLSDTVGFIENLPPTLVASFKATLGVVREADLLIHVIDISHPRVEERIDIVEKVLNEIGCKEQPKLLVFNKIDIILDPKPIIERFKNRYPDAIFISALTGENLDLLKDKILEYAGLKSDIAKEVYLN